MTISEIIRNTIKQEGPISFERFMEMALYYPDLGYYQSDRNPIGSGGDYYTIPHLTPVFGAMIAQQLKEMWEILGQPATFTVAEIGAGNGQLCRSILSRFETMPNFTTALQYLIIERSPAMIARAKSIVPPSVRFYESVEAIPFFSGCVLSNELFDNIPFSILVQNDELMEVFVGYDLDFFEVLQPASDKVKDLVRNMAWQIPMGTRTEISLASWECMSQVASKLQKGFVSTIDYGFSDAQILDPTINAGTLTCFYQHQMHKDPFIHIGEQDITCKVNFSCLSGFGKASGLETAGYVNQANFLRSLGLMAYLTEYCTLQNESAKSAQFLANLLLQNSKFKVLVQYKGLPQPRLTGLSLREPIRL